MESSKQLGVREFLRTLFGLRTEPANRDSRPDTTPLEVRVGSLGDTNRNPHLIGHVESLGDVNKYHLDIAVKRGAGEKGAYFIDCADLIRFIDVIYPSYVRGVNGQDIQVNFHSDKPSSSKTFSNFRELTKYAQELDGMVVCDPIVSISYSGPNKDVPKQILIERTYMSSSATDYSVFVEAAKNYNLMMIDVCAGKLFSGRPPHYPHQAQLSGSGYDTLYGVLVQYEPTQSAITSIRTIKSPPVNPNGGNILNTIEALSGLGYKTNRIEVIPGQPISKGDNFITEQQLSGSQNLEYLAFTIFFDNNSAGIQYLALGRQYGQSGQRDSPQFGYMVGLVKGRPSNGEVQNLLETIKKYVFDWKEVGISPIDPNKLPRGQPFI